LSANKPETGKIAIFLPSMVGGGAERVMKALAGEFVAKGYAVDLLLAQAEGPYLNEISGDVKVINFDKRHILSCVFVLSGYLKENQPKVLLSALSHANLVAIWAKWISGTKTKVVVSEHNSLEMTRKNIYRRREILLPVLMKIFYRWADHIVAVSEGVRNDLIALVGISPESVTTIYNPIGFSKLEKDAGETHHPWLTGTRTPVVLAVGRLTRQKDFITLIKAIDIASKSMDLFLIILGEGEDREKLLDVIEERQLNDIVDMPGFIERPEFFYENASVLVLSSAYEGFGNVLIEALAFGTPVVSTDCPSGPAEILGNGKYGKLVPVGDAEAMASAIIQTLSEEPDTELLKDRADDFSADKIAQQYLQVISA